MQDLNSNLAEILDSTPRRRVDFDLGKVDLGKLTLIELLDAGDASGIPFDDFRTSMIDPSKQAYLFYALAWVILRRVDKSLTYEEVCEFDLIVTGEFDEEEMLATEQRAKAVVSVAQVAGVSPREAGEMTIAEVGAAVDIASARMRRGRRRK